MRERFLVNVVAPDGRAAIRLALSRRTVRLFLGGLLALLVGLIAANAWHVHTLEVQADVQRQEIDAIDRQTAALAGQVRELQRQNSTIRRQIGVPVPKAVSTHADRVGTKAELGVVMARVAQLQRDSQSLQNEQQTLQRMVAHVLVVRRLERVARDRLIAYLPSINPVDGQIAAGFGWRTNPWPEFHQGLDLEADYGDPVHAAASGRVVSATWEGGFGLKVDLDHGNGYHTWYAHLSKVFVPIGASVRKGQVIARVGATGDATGPHLHYQIMRNGEAIDPAPFLDGVPAKVLATLPGSRRVQ